VLPTHAEGCPRARPVARESYTKNIQTGMGLRPPEEKYNPPLEKTNSRSCAYKRNTATRASSYAKRQILREDGSGRHREERNPGKRKSRKEAHNQESKSSIRFGNMRSQSCAW